MAQIEGDLGAACGLTGCRTKHGGASPHTPVAAIQCRLSRRARRLWARAGRSQCGAEAEHRLHDTNLDILRNQLEEQRALAAIERLTGGDL